MATQKHFDAAAERLLGKNSYQGLLASGYSRPDFCREVAQLAFIGHLPDSASTQDDLVLIRQVAERLWKGAGDTGLDE
ncbi:MULTISPECIES: hypothetical protein [Pseudomonas]|jgi:hypothetical protein|uniref:hypothetical protein n=1 Tax=Pseudomonas TaxID=286 RepID=UPI00023A4367|nr:MULTISPECIES: hypothetical protein [Pseudomonas]EHK69133.1 hypothetical protein PPL19_20811 [Pseudomonas psychrotolerans L19]KXJ33226.1 hypothetical protein AX284_08545 [Pseudomonas sp. HUK17]MBA1183360.1 hypothetical protein [Pseudomonas psychrotolerans]MBA1214074.1 hypothetical protein [Pseudomonas psychrotolerans]NRH44901.1 hypothetical protein [Pseudomonas sp. MS15a(2019)]